MPPPPETALTKQVMEYLVAEYRGSGDPEVFDALDFCSFFAKKYPETDDLNNLKERILELREFARRARPDWNAPATSLTWSPLMPPPTRGSC